MMHNKDVLGPLKVKELAKRSCNMKGTASYI